MNLNRNIFGKVVWRMLVYSKLISNSGAGCRSHAGDAFVPTAAVNYLHSVLLHNSVSEQTVYI